MNTNQQLYRDLMKRKCKQWWSTIPKVCFQVTIQTIMKAKFQMWWPTIPPISTKQTITCHLKSLNIKKTMTYIKCWKSRSWFGQAPKYGWVKPVNVIPTNKKPAQIRFHSERPHTYHKNEWHEHGQYNNRVSI